MAENFQKFENQTLLKLVSELELYRFDSDAPPFILTELVTQFESFLADIFPNDLKQPARHSTSLENSLQVGSYNSP